MKYKIDKSGEVVLEKDLVVENNQKDTKKRLQQINLFSKQVVEKMIKDGVPPTPSNFLVYFEKNLDEKPPAQRENILDFCKQESHLDLQKEYLSKIDQYIDKIFSQTKNLLEDTNILYTKSSKIINYIKLKGLEVAKNPTKANISAFENKIKSALKSLQKQNDLIKEDYIEVATTIKEFNKSSIVDKKYEVYNKKYFLSALEAELKEIKKFMYKDSIIAFCIKKEILKDIKLGAQRDIIVKTVAKMILQRSRRSDILAHYEDGVFLLLLKHTDLEQAKRALKSIKEYVSLSNFIIDQKQVVPQLDSNIIEIDPRYTKEEIIANAIEGLIDD